jgi:hypothetical protein
VILESSLAGTRILLIDRNDDWRRNSACELRAVGAAVEECQDYDPSLLLNEPSYASFRIRSFDLVVLGCPSVREEEKRLIGKILEDRGRLLVLSSSLPCLMMRLIFLAGVDDIADKPYDSITLVEVVSEALSAIKPRDSYQAVARGRWI